ncbi:MAG: phage tail protein [Lachnospiraceae bacterium]
MYEILMDGRHLWYPGDKECVVFSPTLTESLNDAGYLEFKIPPDNPLYSRILERISMIQVLKDGSEVFYGMVKETSVNFRREKNVYAVGILSFLADSIQPQKKFQDVTPYAFINELVQKHNEQVEERKRFEVGAVTVRDSNDSIYRYTNYEDTLTALREKICDKLGGYIRVRRTNGRNILDVVTLEDYGKTCGQAIEFGENLLDYAESTSTDEIATAVLPRGHQLDESPVEGLPAYLTIESVNDGKDYVCNEDAVKKFGWIKRVVDFSDVTLPENLIKKAREWLTDKQFASLTLELNAIDMSVLDRDIQSFELGDYIHAIASPFGMDSWFPVQQKTTCLSDASQNTIVLSNTVRKSYTQQLASTEKGIAQRLPQKGEILQAAKNNASALIKQATNGYIALKMDDKGNPCELLIMDSKNIDEARKVWRWNLNGFGYSSTGYNGEYGLAMTMDGAIVADFITAGTMCADRIKGGTLQLGGMENTSGVAHICDESGNVLVTLDKGGITLAPTVKIAWANLDEADDKVTQLAEDTIKTTNVVAENLRVKTANIEGELSADKITSGTLQGVAIISKDADETHSIKVSIGEIKGFQEEKEVGSLDFSDGTREDGVLRPSMRWRAQQAMSIKTPRFYVSENPSQSADVTRCRSTDITVVTGVSGGGDKITCTTKTLRFINGILVTA